MAATESAVGAVAIGVAVVILIATAHNCLLVFMRSEIGGLMSLVYCYDINPSRIHRNQKCDTEEIQKSARANALVLYR